MTHTTAHDLLLELGCEDLPARYVMPLANSLAAGVTAGLAKRGVGCGANAVYATPRRIAVLVKDVAGTQPEQAIERSGPALAAAYKDGKPTPAALGFAKSCGVEFAALAEKDGKLFHKKTLPGKPTAALIAEIFEETLKGMDELVPKRMRWGSGEQTFVRPVSWMLCLLGAEVVPLARFGVESGRITYGHRFHAPDAISLASPAGYVAALKTAKVWADVDSRKDEIERQIKAEAAKLKGQARITEDLLNEVTALVEWPVVISGRMEERFMRLPPEVIVSTVETNQRYFTVFTANANRQLMPYFITVSNIESRDVAQVISGNERVVRPRLTDAMFFWEQDLNQPLEAYGLKLQSVTFQKELGTVADKVKRIRKLAIDIASLVPRSAATPEMRAEATERLVACADRAAFLCKNDLVTRVVYEFPELQGLMGSYYAAASDEPDAVAEAIRDHYLPNQQAGRIPSSYAGRVVALADKLDTLAGIFAIGQKPTASKDPFALRRAALGVLRICIEGQLPLDLRTLLQRALETQPAGKRDAATLAELVEFVMERLRAYAVIGGVTTEMFEAVKALGIAQPLDFHQRLQAVQQFVALPEAANLAAAHKRVRNILRQAGGASGSVDAQHFEHDAERALHAGMQQVQNRNGSLADYTAQLINLAQLRAPVDAFFDAVMVNADDPAVRANRLALLAQLDTMCREVADISLLPG